MRLECLAGRSGTGNHGAQPQQSRCQILTQPTNDPAA